MDHDRVEETSPEEETSEATPPRTDSPPAMRLQPSPPEEQTVTSSTDRQPHVVAGSPYQQSVSSTTDQRALEGFRSRNLLRLLLETNEAEAEAVEDETPTSDPEPESENQPEPKAQRVLIQEVLHRAAAENTLVQPKFRLDSIQNIFGSEQTGFSQNIINGAVKESVVNERFLFNSDFVVNDVSSLSQLFPEQFNLGSNTYLRGSYFSDVQRRNEQRIER